MKRILTLFVAVLMLLSVFASCSQEETTTSGEGLYTRRTLAFFEEMSKGEFWFKANVVKVTGSTYSYTQATNGVTTTTIDDDGYRIYYNMNGKRYVHEIKVSEKKYDTYINRKGSDFLFKGYNYTQFAEPVYIGEEELDGKTYYCEYFVATTNESGNVTVYDKYFFDGNTLVAVVTPAVTIYFEEYSTEVPDYIFFEPPSDYTAGRLTEETEIDYNEIIK